MGDGSPLQGRFYYISNQFNGENGKAILWDVYAISKNLYLISFQSPFFGFLMLPDAFTNLVSLPTRI